MSDVSILIDRNRSFAEGFNHGQLPMRPNLSTFLLTCLDARVDPAHIFGLEPGDAIVMRNAGGRINQAVMSNLAVLGFLASKLPVGAEPLVPELVVMHHTDCGMSRLADPEAQSTLSSQLGIDPQAVAAMAVTDPKESVASDIAKLRGAKGIPDGFVVSGFVYDVTTGMVSQVVPPNPLR